MGNSQSNVRNLLQYQLNNNKLMVKLLGGQTALKTTVKNGSVVRITLAYTLESTSGFLKDSNSNYLKKYFTSDAFIKDLNETIMLRFTNAPNEASLKISKNTVSDLFWKVSNRATIKKTNTITFDVNIVSKDTAVEYLFTEAVAYMASCMAWHINHGSIPVHDEKLKHCVLLTKALTFSKFN